MMEIEGLCEEKAERLKALAHPVRLRIVRGLLIGGCRNVGCMCEGTGQSQSAISQHLMRLKAAGVVRCWRSGNEMYYEVANAEVSRVVAALFQDEEGDYECPTILSSSAEVQRD